MIDIGEEGIGHRFLEVHVEMSKLWRTQQKVPVESLVRKTKPRYSKGKSRLDIEHPGWT